VQAAAARHGRAVLLYASRALIVLALLAALGALTWRNPLLSDEPIGRVPVLNWLLYAYGAPGLLLAAYAWRIRGAREERGLHFATAAAAVILLFAMVSLQTRHAFHLDDVREPARSLREVATYAVLWLAAALVTRAAAERWAREILLWTSRGLIVAALLAAAVTLTDRNPLWRAEWIGDSPALNWLLYAYGLPAALLCLCGLQLQARPDDRPWRHAVGPAALILLFALVTLETRRFFHHPQLTGPAPTPAEWYAYSAAWVGLGVADRGRARRRADAALGFAGRDADRRRQGLPVRHGAIARPVPRGLAARPGRQPDGAGLHLPALRVPPRAAAGLIVRLAAPANGKRRRTPPEAHRGRPNQHPRRSLRYRPGKPRKFRRRIH